MKLFKTVILSVLFILLSNYSKAQLMLSYHQYLDDNLVGISYELNHLRPEFRFGVNRILEEIALEFNLNYILISNEKYNFYSGVGYNNDLGINSFVIPIGLNIYPFELKEFGFLIEIKPTFSDDVYSSLRGSIGIQYTFK